MAKDFRSIIWNSIVVRPRLRKALTMLIHPDEETSVDLFGAKYSVHKRKDTSVWRAFKYTRASSIFRNEAPQLTSLALLLRSDDCFVDVGANIGLHSAVYAKLLNIYPTLQIYAFEPHPETFSRLKKTIGYNVHSSNVHLFNLGLSDHDGVMEFALGAESSEFGVGLADSFWRRIRSQTLKINCSRLDSIHELLTKLNLILKIDVEGHEWEVLQGCEKLFDTGAIDIIMIDGYANKEIPKFLSASGFRLYDAHSLRSCESRPSEVLVAIHERRLVLG
jgi:FkbM family methyltransferase